MKHPLLLAALLLGLPSSALAGRQPFSEVVDVEVLPARVAELQVGLADIIGTPGGEEDETAMIWGAAFGLTDRVELWLNSEVAASHASGATEFTWYAAELRWRLAPTGPPPGPMHPVPLVRLVVERSVGKQLLEPRVDLVVGTDLTEGLHSAILVGATAVSTGEEAQLQGGLGLTGDVTQSVRLGGEVFVELPIVPDAGAPSLAVGPDASFTLAQFWITTGALAGLGADRAYDVAVHINWGVEF